MNNLIKKTKFIEMKIITYKNVVKLFKNQKW